MTWRTARASAGGACAEVDTYRKSSASAFNGDCAEVGAFRKAEASKYWNDCAEVGAYRKSSASESTGDCAEIGGYRKSSASINDATGGSECLEAGTGLQVVGVRDSKQKDLGYPVVLEFSPDAWMRFLDGLR